MYNSIDLKKWFVPKEGSAVLRDLKKAGVAQR